MPIRTGISTLTYEQYMIGPGAIYVGWASAASPGTLLGETKGGNTFEVLPTYHEYEPDGAIGHVKNHTVIASVIIRLTANLSGVTLDNLKRVLPGSTSTNYDIVHIPTEWGMEATAGNDTFTPLGGATIVFSTLKVYEDGGAAAPTLLTLGTHYTVNEGTGAITEVGLEGWTNATNILVEYDYDTGGAGTTSIITLDKVDSDDYISNVAIVGEISDINKTLDAVLIVENALCMNGLTLSLPGGSKEAVVMPAIFEGHWDPASAITLANAPFQIVYGLG